MTSSETKQDVVLVADLAHALEVALGRHEAAAGVLHRLQEDRRDRLGPLELDPLGDRVGEVLGAVAGREAVEVRVRDVAAAGRERLERRAQARDARGGDRAQRRAVVGRLAGDDLRLVRVAGELVVLAHELDRALDRLRAAAREEDAVEVPGRERGDLRRQLDRRRVRVGPVGEEPELLGLVGAGLRDVGAAVADVDAEQRAEPVEVAVAVLVPDVATLAADQHRDVSALLVRAHARVVQPQVALGQLLQVPGGRGVLGRCHTAASPVLTPACPIWHSGCSICTTVPGDNGRRQAIVHIGTTP